VGGCSIDRRRRGADGRGARRLPGRERGAATAPSGRPRAGTNPRAKARPEQASSATPGAPGVRRPAAGGGAPGARPTRRPLPGGPAGGRGHPGDPGAHPGGLSFRACPRAPPQGRPRARRGHARLRRLRGGPGGAAGVPGSPSTRRVRLGGQGQRARRPPGSGAKWSRRSHRGRAGGRRRWSHMLRRQRPPCGWCSAPAQLDVFDRHRQHVRRHPRPTRPSVLAGSIGVLPSASLGAGGPGHLRAHATARRRTSRGRGSPTRSGRFLSAAMMLLPLPGAPESQAGGRRAGGSGGHARRPARRTADLGGKLTTRAMADDVLDAPSGAARRRASSALQRWRRGPGTNPGDVRGLARAPAACGSRLSLLPLPLLLLLVLAAAACRGAPPPSAASSSPD